MDNLKWTFPERGLQDANEAFDGTLSNFDGKLGSILREAIQNSADARWPAFDNEKKVEVRVSVIKLSDAVNSQLIILTLTPVLLIPLPMASAIAAVFPYALANNRATLKLLYFWLSPQLW